VERIFLWAAILETAAVGVLLVRLAIGPTISDRIVALNTIATQGTLSVLLFASSSGRSIYLDVAIWLASFSYLGTIVWSRYLERGLL
jgi:multisubunit Na+/H+ antiporter MnhF subunit